MQHSNVVVKTKPGNDVKNKAGVKGKRAFSSIIMVYRMVDLKKLITCTVLLCTFPDLLKPI